MNHLLPKRLVAEAVGTAMLLAAVAGSGRQAVSDIALGQHYRRNQRIPRRVYPANMRLSDPGTLTALP